MKKIIAGCFAIVLATAALAEAQATRTWVSGVGDDANPCSRTAPCKTFAGAISKTATGGYINALDSAGFGALTITKSITIEGNGVIAGVLAAGTSGITISTNPNLTVVLRNLSIEGFGTGTNGIRVVSSANTKLHIENVTIQNFITNGIVTDSSNAELFISDTTVSAVTNQGIYIQSGQATISRSNITQTGVGVLSGYTAQVNVKNSIIAGNAIGLGALYATTAQLNIEDSFVSHNDTGVLANGGATARMSRTSFFNNSVTALSNGGAGSQLISFSNNMFAGNLADGAFSGNIAVK